MSGAAPEAERRPTGGPGQDILVVDDMPDNVAILLRILRGFTSLANQAAPEEIQETLNSFLDVMVDNITRVRGMVDKYLGDGVMALFGAPFRQPAA